MKFSNYLVMIVALLLSGCSIQEMHGHYQTTKSKLFLSLMSPADYFNDKNQLALLKAAGRCDEDRVERLLEGGTDPDAVGKEAMTLLTWMVVKQNYRGLECLLKAGSTPDLQVEVEQGGQRMYVTALEYAAAMPDTRYLRLLLEYGADPALAISPVTGTPVAYIAMLAGRKEALVILVQYGFDVNHMGHFGATPISYAYNLGRYEIALWLLEHGADPTLKDESNPRASSALDFVKRYGATGMNIWSRREINAYNELIDALIAKGYLAQPPLKTQSP